MARPIALIGLLLLSATALAQPAPLAITHVTVIDATGAAPQRDMRSMPPGNSSSPGSGNHLEQRRRIAAGDLVGPRLAIAGTIREADSGTVQAGKLPISSCSTPIRFRISATPGASLWSWPTESSTPARRSWKCSPTSSA